MYIISSAWNAALIYHDCLSKETMKMRKVMFILVPAKHLLQCRGCG